MRLIAIESVVQLQTEKSPTLGKADAPITIAVFDDFECPYCAKAVPLFKQVMQQYSGKVKMVFKNFPLSFHKNARPAAIAALAADRQDKFWQFHDLLFANHSQLTAAKIQQLAEQAGLNMEQFNRDRADQELQRMINNDLQEGKKVGVRGTPTVFINGRRLPQRSLPAFSQMIEAELARLAAAKE